MAGVVSGKLTLVSTLNVAVPAGSAVPVGYNVPVSPLPGIASATYAAGTGAGQANKVAYVTGSAAAAAASIDLTTLVCLDGQTGFSHVREILVFNNDAAHTLTWDFSATNANVAMYSSGGATALLTIQPGAYQRFSKPLGTNGYVVDSTHKIVSLDPGANTVSYTIYAAGD